MVAPLIVLWTLQGTVHTDSAKSLAQQISMELGRLALLSIFLLVACFVVGRIFARGPRLVRTMLLGIGLLTFFAVQGRLVYVNSDFQRGKSLVVSKRQIEDNLNGRMFYGKKVLPLLVADYMPYAKVFLYDRTLYSRDFLSWSGRNPDDTFIVGGYRSSINESIKKASQTHPHTIYDGLYIAMPLSTYEKEREVYMMNDGLMDYLIPGSWLNSRHE
jgi:hypothetical protein